MESRRRERCQRRASTSPTKSSRLLLYYTFGLLIGSSVAAAIEVNPLMMRDHMDHMGMMARAEHKNLQLFTGSLGPAPPAVTSTGDTTRPFGVNGDTFIDFEDAGQRSCNMQFDDCQQQANSNKTAGFTVKNCQSQQTSCIQSQQNAKVVSQGSGESTSTSSTSSSSTSTSTEDSISTTSTSSSTTDTTTTADIETTSTTSTTAAAAAAQTTIIQDQFILVCDL